MTTGPDLAQVHCHSDDGCCGFSPCALSEDDFICQIRTLLPESPLFIASASASKPAPSVPVSITVGCAIVGCGQLVEGGCCPDPIVCDDDPPAVQLAVFDSFAAAAFQVVQSLCVMLRELDPCTATYTVRTWAARFDVGQDDPCLPEWSDYVLQTVLCSLVEIRRQVLTFAVLEQIAARFGASFVVREAGDFNCGPPGWWTMARNGPADCPKPQPCPPEARPRRLPLMRLRQPCESLPMSLNLVLSPTDITVPGNCNLPAPEPRPHDPELYQAFKWLLPKILPGTVYWCVYDADPENCIV